MDFHPSTHNTCLILPSIILEDIHSPKRTYFTLPSIILEDIHNPKRTYLILPNIILKDIYPSTHCLTSRLETRASTFQAINMIRLRTSTYNPQRTYLTLPIFILKDIHPSTHCLNSQLETWALAVGVTGKISQTRTYLIKGSIYNRTVPQSNVSSQEHTVNPSRSLTLRAHE